MGKLLAFLPGFSDSTYMNTAPKSGLIIIVMGVGGCGKSTVAKLMANQLDMPFFDADDLHPAENKRLMSAGIALTDENRLPWLQAVKAFAASDSTQSTCCVIACSALKQAYRNLLREAPGVCYVHLQGPKSLIQQRMKLRSGHFMPATLLDSQFDALEPPDAEPDVVSVTIEPPPEQVARNAITALIKADLLN